MIGPFEHMWIDEAQRVPDGVWERITCNGAAQDRDVRGDEGEG
jgi:hypothetical protein